MKKTLACPFDRAKTAAFAGTTLRTFTLAAALGLMAVASPARATSVAAWDFFGESNQATSAADVFNANLDSSSNLTRGATATASTGANSFRTLGFKNEGISTANTDYFQFTLSAATGFSLSLSTIDATFNGTGSFFASPGVTSQFAYSLDGSTFTLIGSPVQSTSLTMAQISLTGVSALQNVAAGTTVTLRYYASGQTTSGGWGFFSASAGAYGLNIGGSLALAGGSTVSIGASGNTTFTPSSFGGAPFTSLDVAKFDSGAGDVALSGAVSAAGLIFTTDAYTLSSPTGSDTISTSTMQVDAPTATISGKITGANPLSKLGSGTLVLSGTSSDFVGAITISAGTLQISADSNLGAAANDIVLSGGTLKAVGTFSLGITRDISGTGSIDVGSGDTLTVTGTTNASLTLTNSGTVALMASGSNTLPLVTFAAPGTLNVGAFAATLSGVTTTHSSGTAILNGPINLGGANRTFNIGNGASTVDLQVNSAITSTGTFRLSKIGAGTLQLTGDNSGMGGIQLGIQGASPTDGGVIQFAAANALGNPANQIQANYGTLQATSTITSTGGLSIGGRSTGFLTFAGSDMTYGGTTSSQSFFRAAATTGELRFNVNNTTTLGGTFVATSGGGTATGITVGGSGKLVIAGDASPVLEKWTTLDSLTLELASTGKIGVGGIGLASGTTLKFDIDSTSAFGSTTGALTGTGGALEFALNTTAQNTWALFAGGSGTVSTVGISGIGYGPVALTNVGGNIWTGSSGTTLFTFDLGAGTLVAVPEPGEYAAAIAGLLGVVVLMRRRKLAQIEA